MCAHDAYQLVVGEIGIPREQFLYDLEFWEVRAIIRGYRRKQETEWAQLRWQTFWLMHNGMVDLGKVGIHQPSDLMQLPHDGNTGDDSPPISDEEIDALQAEMRAYNAEQERKKAEEATISD